MPSHEHFIEINTSIIKAFQKKTTQTMVADIKDMGILSVESQKWVSNTLLPELINLLKGKTLFQAQLLNPKEILSKVSANNVKRYAESIKSNFVIIPDLSDLVRSDYFGYNFSQLIRHFRFYQ
ncbi:MAG: hypothetical protein SNJ77_04850 [Cytophagales bacterium]